MGRAIDLESKRERSSEFSLQRFSAHREVRTAITSSILALASRPSRLSLRSTRHTRASALTNRSAERGPGSYVMADKDAVHQQVCDAGENKFAGRPAHGPSDGSGVLWLQLLDDDGSRAQGTRCRGPHPELSCSRRPPPPTHPDPPARSGTAHRTLERGRQYHTDHYASLATEGGTTYGHDVQTRHRLVGQVLPERAADQGVESQQQGVRCDQSAEA